MDIKKIYLEEVNSTNLFAKEHLDEIEDRTIVYTYRQMAGRGRFDRQWKFVGEDNIYMSFVLKPAKTFKPVYANLTQYLSVILSRVVEKYGLVPKIKWANDVLVNGKKIAGILSESSVRGEELAGIVLGIGVNINAGKELFSDIEKPASSIALELGRCIDKEEFLKKLYSNFFLYYDKFLSEGFSLIRKEYLSKSSFINQTIKVAGIDRVIEGEAVDVMDAGTLVLKENNGQTTTLWIGDIL